jgi:hypothetical protein
MGRPYVLHNGLDDPASEDELVAALLAFANGREVTIRDQEDRYSDEPPELSDVTRWSKRQPHASTDDHLVFSRILCLLVERPEELVSYCNDRVVDGRYYAVYGFVRWIGKQERLFISKPHSRLGITDDIFGPEEVRDDSWLTSFWPQLRELSESIVREPVVTVRADSYSIIEYRRFVTVSAALTCGLFALLDENGPFRATLCRCKLPRCGSFYLARKNPRGGPPNRTYCDDTHREEHHNSAARKKQARKPK